ncbi:heme ABC transporter ATP-binding protein [Pseudomonas oryzihabitans]|uniref:heme ABC transporter ATP-binding protein n=1 Tax=Pseudomonas oryzihabitans TaxID=47885 RepID=UPI002893F4AE|nr:heme ABC transporter ATP-binding protein [Pseudomonas oryzihabitans]MDT3723143.1 heme ABC transporter ATP-binding protein [Pseudomonas oryzihabitans]
MLELRNAGFEQAGKWRLQPLDLTVTGGEVMGILGPNGAGKSTLLGLMAGEVIPTAGAVMLDGFPLPHWTGLERALRLAVLPQTATLGFEFTVEEVISFGRSPHNTGLATDNALIGQLLLACDLAPLRHRSYLQLSGGERQRVQIARVMAQLSPAAYGKVLLLDEPVAALDPRHQHRTLRLAREAAGEGAAVVVVLHDLNLAARYCDRLLLLERGCVVALGIPGQVLRADWLERLFGLPVIIQQHPQLGHPLVVVQ